MITQLLIDWFVGIFADLVRSLPPLPSEVMAVVDGITGGMAFFGARLESLGMILPFDAIGVILSAWAVVFVYWTAVAIWKAIAWVFGR